MVGSRVDGRDVWPESAPLLRYSNSNPLARAGPRSSSRTLLGTFCTIIVSVVGAGVLGLPYAFKKSGWLASSITLVCVGAINTHCMLLLERAHRALLEQRLIHHWEDVEHLQTFGGIAQTLYGTVASIMMNLIVSLAQACACVAYLVFIAENLASLVPPDALCYPPFLPNPRLTIIAILFPVQALFALAPTLHDLQPVSHIAVVAEVVAMGVVLCADMKHLQNFKLSSVLPFTGTDNLPFIIGVATYAFEGIPLTLKIQATMRDPEKFPRVLVATMAGIAGLYVSFALLGYFAFGDLTKDIITLNLPEHARGTLAVKLGLCIGLFFTFPFMLHPCFDIFKLKFKSSKAHGDYYMELPSPPSHSNSSYWRIMQVALMRVLLVALVFLVAAGVPQFTSFMAIVGATLFSLLSYIMPALFHLHICVHEMHWVERIIVNPSIITFGFFFAVWGTWSALYPKHY